LAEVHAGAKFEICRTIRAGLARHQLSYSPDHKWKRRLEVGVRAWLRNGHKPTFWKPDQCILSKTQFAQVEWSDWKGKWWRRGESHYYYKYS
jgi:hypothetical protein